jgi:hypothetical protein
MPTKGPLYQGAPRLWHSARSDVSSWVPGVPHTGPGARRRSASQLVCVETVVRVWLIRQVRRFRNLDKTALRIQLRSWLVPPLYRQHDTRAPVLPRPAEHVLDELNSYAGSA